jgi:hypothetical protein
MPIKLPPIFAPAETIRIVNRDISGTPLLADINIAEV